MHADGHAGRYAPSPTGELHLGNLRTALAAWLHARSHGARFVLRIDDLDPDRVRPGIAERQLADLAAIGIDWDGDPVRQSGRVERYETMLAELERGGRTYPCFCSRADIRAAASAPHGHAPDGAYPGTCARVSSRALAARVAAGEPHCIRVRADGAEGAYEDELLGPVHALVDDFVVRRRDGVVAYQLATVVDDHDLDIDVVVRGSDLAASTPRQRWLARLLGLRTPRFAHVGLVLGPDGTRLAKRHGAVTLADLAAQGVHARGALALLARSLELASRDEQLDAASLVERFDAARIPRGDVVLDPAPASPA